MEMFNVDNILKEIEGYDVNRDDAIEFILQDEDSSYDSAFFFYKSSILSIIQCRTHLDKMLDFYYGNIPIDFILDITYKSFILGNNDSLKSVFSYAEMVKCDFLKLIKRDDFKFENSSFDSCMKNIIGIIKKLDIYVKYRNAKLRELNEFGNDKGNIDSLNRLLNMYNKKIEIMLENLRFYFDSCDCSFLYEEIGFASALNNDDLESSSKCYLYELERHYNFVCYYDKLIDDIVCATNVIKGYYQIKGDIKDKKSLSEVCIRIRNLLFGEDGLKIRDCNLVHSNEFMASTSSLENVESDFRSLEKQFLDVMSEFDNDLFIRKCARFHFDFLRVHPFRDGNGRTSRILLTNMFLSRNILMPSLYRDDYEKSDFYIEGDTALYGDYSNIEKALFEKLSRYYPSVIPQYNSNRKK